MDSNISDIHELENLTRNDDTDRNDVKSSIRTTKIQVIPAAGRIEENEIDYRRYNKPTNLFATKRMVAKGMMDIALLTANANQLRFLITYNYDAKTFYVNLILIILSLVLQIAVGIALIFKRQMKNHGKVKKADRTNEFLVVGVFMITVINVFVAAFTTTDSIPK